MAAGAAGDESKPSENHDKETRLMIFKKKKLSSEGTITSRAQVGLQSLCILDVLASLCSDRKWMLSKLRKFFSDGLEDSFLLNR